MAHLLSAPFLPFSHVLQVQLNYVRLIEFKFVEKKGNHKQFDFAFSFLQLESELNAKS